MDTCGGSYHFTYRKTGINWPTRLLWPKLGKRVLECQYWKNKANKVISPLKLVTSNINQSKKVILEKNPILSLEPRASDRRVNFSLNFYPLLPESLTQFWVMG